jgi:hypothetical protein
MNEAGRIKQLEAEAAAMREALGLAAGHCEELRKAWRRGALHESDTLRNVEVLLAAQDALSSDAGTVLLDRLQKAEQHLEAIRWVRESIGRMRAGLQAVEEGRATVREEVEKGLGLPVLGDER